jgi:polyisoprenoid-binding protein YceI
MTSNSHRVLAICCRFLCPATFGLLVLLILNPLLHAQESAVELDPVATKIEFTLGASLHTVHGSFKLKSGAIHFDSSTGVAGGAIVIDALSGESGNSSRDKRMHRDILESDRFPEIILTPKQLKGTLARTGPSKLEVTGQIRLDGQDHEITLPVDVQLSGQEFHLTAHIEIPYVQWGLKNPSTFILRVSDKVAIDIRASGAVTRKAAQH